MGENNAENEAILLASSRLRILFLTQNLINTEMLFIPRQN